MKLKYLTVPDVLTYFIFFLLKIFQAKFSEVKDLVIPLFDQNGQLETGKVTKDWTMGKAVEEGMIDNETLAFFMSRTYLFLLKAGK